MTVARADAVRATRAIAVYHFLEWLGVAVVTVAGDDPLARAVDHARALAVLRTGRPDFRGPEARCLAELLDLGARP